MNTTEPPAVLVVEDLAGILHLSPVHVRRLLRNGELPGVRRGRRWYARRADVLRYLAPSVRGEPVSEPVRS